MTVSVSTIPAAKTAILAAIQSRAGLSTLNAKGAITWSHPGDDIQREAIFMASAEVESEEVVALRPRRHIHDEKYVVPVWVDVVQEGNDPQTAETRMWALVGEVEQAIRDITPDAVATGLLTITVSGKTPDEWLDIGGSGRGVRCRIAVSVEGRSGPG